MHAGKLATGSASATLELALTNSALAIISAAAPALDLLILRDARMPPTVRTSHVHGKAYCAAALRESRACSRKLTAPITNSPYTRAPNEARDGPGTTTRGSLSTWCVEP